MSLGVALYFGFQLSAVEQGEVLQENVSWVPGLGIQLSFYGDGLALLFALLIAGIGSLVLIYAGGYLKGHPDLGKLYSLLLLFMGAMLGVVLSGNLLLLFVFWELTSISSYMLVGFHHERAASRAAALQALLVTGCGGLALMAGLLLLGHVGGSYEMSQLMGRNSLIVEHELYLPILVLVLLGAFTKSAQFPFHFWLPGAMEAPTPVSAYLHSATMVKAGVYLIARMTPVLGGTMHWHLTLAVVGSLTMLVGAYLALRESDLKRILAYSTVSALGTLVMLLASGTADAAKAAVVFLLVHSLYKGALFLVAGAIDHEAGTRDVNRLGGLRKLMPITATAAIIAAISMAGLPPMFGFIGKELLYETTWYAEEHSGLLTAASVAANSLLFAVAGIVAIGPFFGVRQETPSKPHEAPLSMWLGPALLGVLGITFGVAPMIVSQRLLAPAASAIVAQPVEMKLALWHGFNIMLALSLVTVVCGFVIYISRQPIRRAIQATDPLLEWGPANWYSQSLRMLVAVANFQTRVLQNGILGLYLVVVLLATVGLVLGALVTQVPWSMTLDWTATPIFDLALAALIFLAAMLAIITDSRLTAVAAMGGVGYGMAMLFVLFGAPDLAMTQFAIETLTVVVFLFVMSRLPKFATFSTPAQRGRDALVALLAGATMTLVVLLVLDEPLQSRVSPFYLDNSYLAAKGRNIVNVILVDFRGLDTLGEITVLAVAATGAYGLLKLRMDKEEP